MTTPAGLPGARTIRRARSWLARRLARGDGGFILLESIIAITVITIVMGAVGAEFVSGMISSSQQQAKQGAIRVADSAVEQLRSLHASDLLGGRTCPVVTAQLAAASTAVTPWLANMSVAADPNFAGTDPVNPCNPPLPPSGSATPTIPTAGVTQQPGKVAYTVTDYLGWCWLVNGTGDCTSTHTGVRYLRAVVAVAWTGAQCAAVTCSYVTSSLFSTTSDPTFQVNQPLPPAPVATSQADQTVVVGDSVSLQLNARNGTGVPPFTWAVTTGSLPSGVQLSPTGLISGTVGGSAGSYPITVTVTDAFLRTDSTSFTWTVKPPVTATTPAAQLSTVNTAASVLTLSAAGGTGGYVWTDASPRSLPAGLSISGNQVSGTATATGTFPVTLKVTDSTNHTATVSFVWTVYAKATVSALSTVSTTEGVAVDSTDTYTCPGMTCTLVLSGTVPGLGLSTTTVTGNNTTTTLQVTGNGTIHIAGTVQSTAVTSGTSKTYNPVLTITNPTPTSASTAAVTWTMYAPPTISAPASKVTANSATPSEALSYSCPNGTCTISLAGTVAGLGLSNAVAATAANNTTSLTVPAGSGTVYVNGLVGTVGTAAGKPYTPTVTITDTASISATDTETWTVYTKPTIPSPGPVTTTRNATPSKSIAVTCKTSSCTVAVTGLPAGIGIGTSATTSANATTSVTLSGSATVFLSGKVAAAAAQTAYTVTVTVTDSGVAVASVGIWTVN